MVRPPGPERARHPPQDHRRGNGSGALVPLGRAPLPPGGRARAGRRHWRREPRADRRSGRPGRAVTLASPWRGAPHRASSAWCAVRPKGSGESARIRGEATEAADLGSRVGSGHGHRKRRHLHESRPNGPLATGALPGRFRSRRRRHRRRSGAAHRLAGQPDAGRTEAGAGAQPGAGRYHTRRIGGHGRAARPGPSAQHHGERVRTSRGTIARDVRRQGDGGARSVATLPRVRRALPVRSETRRAGPHPGAPALRSALLKSSAARPRSACSSRRPRSCTTSASW